MDARALTGLWTAWRGAGPAAGETPALYAGDLTIIAVLHFDHYFGLIFFDHVLGFSDCNLGPLSLTTKWVQ